jgi:hypothetical protein
MGRVWGRAVWTEEAELSRASGRTRIDEIVDGIYRIATWTGSSEITFDQFLIDDERPALIHTGTYPIDEAVREAIAEVISPPRWST